MTTNKSSHWKMLRALAVVPAIALALLAFANPKSVAAVVAASVQQDAAVQSVMQSPDPVQAEAVPEVVETEAEAEEQAIEESTVEQAPEEPVPEPKKIYESVEQMPEFPGGVEGLMRYLYQNIQYPPMAAQNNIGGRVVLQFVIDETGQVGDVKVVRSVSEEIDAEAVRVVKSLPKFEPGRQNGEPVAVWYTLPVMFKLQSKPQQEGE